MVATRWPAVVDALVDGMRATAGYRAPGDDDADTSFVLVLDGPEIQVTADGAARCLVIGGQLDIDDRIDIGQSGQSLATLGPGQSRDDRGEIVCQVIVQSGAVELAPEYIGASTMRLMRASAFAVIDAVDSFLRADVTLGIVAPRMLARLGDRCEPRQFATESGAVVAVTFRVVYDTRI